MDDSQEVPWFSVPPEAKLVVGDPDSGHLHFYGPDGKRAVVHVTEGETHYNEHFGYNVWHIDVQGSTATVSPSIHYVGAWHTPNPVQFILVKELGERG